MEEIQQEKWVFDIEYLGLRISSRGFGIHIITTYFKDDYRSLFSLEIYFKSIWAFDLFFYKFIKD